MFIFDEPRKEDDMTFAMFSDDALNKFRTFCGAAGLTKPPSPQGAFDQALKPRKENQMSKYRYTPVPGTGGSLFLRERSNVMAYDEAGKDPNEMANAILQFLSSRLSDDDMRQVREYLMIEAGEDPDNVREAKQMAKASASRGAQDSASARSGQAGFDARFPSARKIGRDDMMGVR
jgi:hypothetical protein